MALVSLKDTKIIEQTKENETKLTERADETGKVISTPAQNSKHAGHLAKGKVQSSAMRAIEAEAETIGLPYLKARDTVTIENIGEKFSGDWRITKVIHKISKSGYTCSLSLAKNNFGGGSNKKVNSAPKAGANTKSNNATPVNEVKSSGTNKPKMVSVNLNTGEIIN